MPEEDGNLNNLNLHYKLCGFLPLILSPIPHQTDLTKTLPLNTQCHLSSDDSNRLGFQTDHNIFLSSLDDNDNEEQLQDECNTSKKKNVKKKKPVSRRRNASVVRQIRDLNVRKCVEIVAKVVGVSVRDDESVRVVVLVDIYLPLAVWTGWQFPKSGTIAASLFKHLSCNWEQRNAMLINHGNYCAFMSEHNESIWNDSDCHILGCDVHRNMPESSKKRLFELHEIFKRLPGVTKEGKISSTRIRPADPSSSYTSGIWDITDDVLVNVLISLDPMDLVRVASTCRHLRSLAVSIMPCMKLNLYPHQQAAIEWMLQRERKAEMLNHPLYMDFSTEDGFHFYMHAVSGEIVTGICPTVTDFRGGMFCDEPGLGKTITALSLILKTQGTLADPPDGVEVVWCTHNDQRCGYYELSSDNFTRGSVTPSWKRFKGHNGKWGEISTDICIYTGNSEPSSQRSMRSLVSNSSCPSKLEIVPYTASSSRPSEGIYQCSSNLSCVTRNLLDSYEEASGLANGKKVSKNVSNSRQLCGGPVNASVRKRCNSSPRLFNRRKRRNKSETEIVEYGDNWVQCDSCSKWRKLLDGSIPDTSNAWFCSMNPDPFFRNCAAPEESWDQEVPITYLPGFCAKGTPGGIEQNVSFFTSVLKENYILMNQETQRALNWLSNLSQDKLLEMEAVGLTRPVLDTYSSSAGRNAYHKIFQALGLIRKVEKGISRWYYPFALENMAFDVVALQIALTKPLDLCRLYLSRATLVVVPANLVDHWKTQIFKHVRHEQLRVYVWTDHKKPSAHSLAWDYDIVITTFNRLSAEWGPRKKSAMMQVHWLRIMLDEGHTLGSSFSLTNKLQMAISMNASNRWLLTGTPTPNTPNSHVSHLQPLLKFLHENVYGQNQKSWEAGILRPFEAEMEEGRSRLLELLQRCMISARKEDLRSIPPCIRNVVYLDFTEEHARTYNELAVTVRRNILMADWEDPDHVESILNPKQWKFRSTLIRNVRLSCCVAGHIKVTEAGHDIQETMDILVEKGLDRFSEEYIFIKIALQDGSSCFRCKEWCRLPVVTPCRHLLCLDCVAMDSTKCTFPGCGHLYEMQSPETLARPENPNPKWPVPKDLIELQPSYKQDDWDPDWHATSSSKVAHLVESLKRLQEVNRKRGYSSNELAVIESNGTSLLPSQKNHCDMLLDIEAFTEPDEEPQNTAPEKVIIFSQFLEHIHVIEQQLAASGIKFVGMYSPMHSSNKMKSLLTFQHDENCMVLLMDGSAALGLDLSFVNHVFLMEPIWDGREHGFRFHPSVLVSHPEHELTRLTWAMCELGSVLSSVDEIVNVQSSSMEEQVISRAHRMGATRPINVEILVMRGTVEEQMIRFLQGDDDDGCGQSLKEEFGRNDQEGGRPRTLHDFAAREYLKKLRFVRKKDSGT